MAEDIDEQSAEELEQAIGGGQDETAAVETAPEATSGYSHTTADGTTYEAATPEELFSKVAGALNNTKTALRDREHQIYDLKTQTPQEPAVEQQYEQYDHYKYIDLLATDSLAAYEYQKAFDPDIQAVRQDHEYAAAYQQVSDEVVKFYRDVPEYATIETQELNDLMKERMIEKGRSNTAGDIGLTYYELKNEGLIQVSSGRPVTRNRPMPVSAAGSSASSESEPDYENMAMDELVAQIKKSGVPGAEYIRAPLKRR